MGNFISNHPRKRSLNSTEIRLASIGTVQLVQTFIEKLNELIDRHVFRFVIQIEVAGSLNLNQFLRFRCLCICILCERSRMSLLTLHKHHRTRRIGFEIVERVEVHKLYVRSLI